MEPNFIYTDTCPKKMREDIKEELGIEVVERLPNNTWSINDALSIITLPSLELAVINRIDEISVMEMALLHFMCKPILITAKSIVSYPMLIDKIITYQDVSCNLLEKNNSFINWYKVREGTC